MRFGRYLLAISLTVTATGCSHMEKLDEGYTAKDIAFKKSFPKSKASCIKAGGEALKEMGAGIDDQTGDQLISNRYSIFEYATAYGGGGTAVAQKISETGKMYIKVSSEGNGCLIWVSRVRAWNNKEEYPKVSVDFVKQKMVTPFFQEVSERLTRL